VPVVGFDNVERFSTGSLSFDRALGGGIPRGRVIDFWGNPSCGKTTLAQLVAIACVKQGGEVAYIDVENTYDPFWAYRLGLTEEFVDHLHLYQPGTGEACIDTVKDLLQDEWIDPETGEVRGAYDLIVFDSVGMLGFSQEREGDASNAHVGLMARKLSTFIRARQPEFKRLNTSFLYINHVTMKVGTMGGNPETQPGGLKLRFANAIEVYFNPPLRDPNDIYKDLMGMLYPPKTTKKKTAIPFRRAFVSVRMDDYFGVDITPELGGMWKEKHGEDTPGLLKDLGLLFNKDGLEYKAGGMYYRDETGELVALEYRTPNGAKPTNSKSTLNMTLYQNPKLRAYFVREVRKAIAAENSVESIKEALRAGLLRMEGSDVVPADSDEAFSEVSDEEFEDSIVTEEEADGAF
jgi:protein RecA